ncbi:MAG: EVE domain-containing protein [Vampirovibrionales bacterium]|nr:EVE domain-containing protein [Vampirovibrionales bacterium]
MPRAYWLLKTEPNEFSYDDLVRHGWTHWDGVRNYQARANLQRMAVGDWALIYHSVGPKEVVGIAEVSKAAYPDPTVKEDQNPWVVIDVKPLKAFTTPVTLATIKATPSLADIPLVRQSRLSVMPLEADIFALLCELGGTTVPFE